jgi:CRISPR-associated endoribonuclease Cas6
MRLLVKLRCLESGPYDSQYHYHLQSLIYDLLRDSKYHYLHDKEGYKFFCFSNIFPSYDIKKGENRTVLISSPNTEIIEYLHQEYELLKSEIKIGGMRFRLDSCRTIDLRPPQDVSYSLITGTPILIRIPREKYRAYGIKPSKDYDYLYWRSEHPVELFMLQIRNNLLKKYNQFSGSDNDPIPDDIGSFPLFQKFQFKKQISTKISMKNSEQIVIGTVWEFGFEGWEDRNLIQFALDAGLGERNSMGFGFMNLQESR